MLDFSMDFKELTNIRSENDSLLKRVKEIIQNNNLEEYFKSIRILESDGQSVMSSSNLNLVSNSENLSNASSVYVKSLPKKKSSLNIQK